jgi:hypothetical protein
MGRGQYNRHIEMCNRVIEGQELGISVGKGNSDWQQEVRDFADEIGDREGTLSQTRDGIEAAE